MKVVKWLDNNFEEFVMAVMLAAMACIMMCQVIMRYVFNNSLGWSEELVRFIFIWSTFISIAYCFRKNISIRIDAVVSMFSDQVQFGFKVFEKVVLIVLYAYMTPFAYRFFINTIESGQTSAAMLWPMEWIYIAPFVGFILAVIRLLEGLIALFKPANGKGQQVA